MTLELSISGGIDGSKQRTVVWDELTWCEGCLKTKGTHEHGNQGSAWETTVKMVNGFS